MSQVRVENKSLRLSRREVVTKAKGKPAHLLSHSANKMRKIKTKIQNH